MGLLYDSGIISGDVSEFTLTSTPYVDQEFRQLVCVNVACASVVSLSTFSATLRWNDGLSNRTQVIPLLLTSLNNYVSVPIFIVQAAGTDLTLEIDTFLSGEYRCVIDNKDMGN